MHLLRARAAAGPAAARRAIASGAVPPTPTPRPLTSPKRPLSSTPARRPPSALPPSASSAPPPAAPALAAQPWLGTPEQTAALDELRARFAASAPTPPPDELLRWYLRDRYFSVDDAERKLRSMLDWRARYATSSSSDDDEAAGAAGALWEPLGLRGVAAQDVARELETGKAYVHDGPDAAGRPVLVVVARKHAVGEYPLEDSKRMCMHLLDEVVSRLPPTQEARNPGDEQLLGIFDLKGFELRNADLPFVAFLVEAFFEYYPRRVGQVLLVDAPWIFQAPWKAIKPLLRKYSALVRFVDRETMRREFFDGGKLAPPRDFVE